MDNLSRLPNFFISFFEEVKDKFNIDQRVYDSRGKRWVKCNFCGDILPVSAFIGTVDLGRGVCIICFHKTRKGLNHDI